MFKEYTDNNKFIVNFIIITLAVAPAFALGEGNRNLLLIGVMSISPIFLLKYPIVIPKIDFPLIIIGFLMACFPLVFHPETLRWSTVLYSFMFILYYMAFVRVLYESEYAIEDLYTLIEKLLYAYCIVLIIQQFCVITGLPIFNVSNYAPNEPFKLNSLTAEPSHSARIVPVLMYLFICCQIKILGDDKPLSLKESFLSARWVWLSFLWITLTMVSTTAFIFMIIVFAKFINVKRFIPSLLLIGAIGLFFAMNSESKTIKRLIDVVGATITLNEKKIIKADHSASFRIVPSIQGAKAVGFSEVNDWVGHGVDADQRMIAPLPSVKYGSAGSFYLWFNFGLIVAFLFWYFTFDICYIKKDLVSILVWILCVWMYGGINNQIVWLSLVLLSAYKFAKANKV